MIQGLKISIGQYSSKGRKEVNQDFYGICVPKEPLLSSKGVVAAVADGISSSGVSHIASESAISSFLEDYYSTSEAWSVKTAGERVLSSTNSWLHSQSQQSQYRFDLNRGYVCTFSALIFKSNKAHIFHVGDTRVYKLAKNSLEQLTEDHRVYVSAEKSYLARALGINRHLDVDYAVTDIEVGDIFILATDGLYEYSSFDVIKQAIADHSGDLNMAAQKIADQSYRRGSTDNLTLQIIRVEELQDINHNEISNLLTELPFAPTLQENVLIDGYKILREIRIGSRSYIYLALDEETGKQVVLKVPSVGMRDDKAYLERFLVEEWVARRINNPHVLKLCPQTRKKSYLYIASEFIHGQSLTQWLSDRSTLDLVAVRDIVGQIGKGLQAFHRLEAIHQDLKPDNILIDENGMVKIIDFGAARVAGIEDMNLASERINFLGSAQYAAPEYFLGESGTPASDIYSLGVIVYQMLSNRFPYGTRASKVRSVKAQKSLVYESVTLHNSKVPVWVDEAIRKAVHPDPAERYQEISEFLFDLENPNAQLIHKKPTPLIERDPIVFWKITSAFLFAALLVSNVLSHLNH